MAAGPVVVRARLTSPYIDGGQPIHLDGLLSLAWVRRHKRSVQSLASSPSRWTPVERVTDPHLPLARISLCGRRVWVASAAIAEEPEAPASVWTTKRRDPEDWDRLDAPVQVTAGPGKDYLIRRGARVVAGLSWLAWGDRREIVRALRLLWGREDRAHGFVGTARRTGSGEVASWSVEVGTHEPADCLVRNELVMRHLPRSWLTAVEVEHLGACESPYWHPDQQIPVARVHTGAQLHQDVIDAIERTCAR